MSIFDTTENILDLYLHAVGRTNIPMSWHKWTCISMVAAALADRVGIRWFHHKPLAPNLYVMLIGPSGTGKGVAIDFGMQFKHERMNILYGQATDRSLFDRMSAPAEPGKVSNSKIFVVQDELAQAVGHSSIANSYIKAMTAWYSTTSGEIEENTRTHGRKVIEDAICVNWLSGTTVEWLQDAMDYKAMMSGGFGRICTIPGTYNYEERVYRPEPVLEYDVIIKYLQERFEELACCMEGEFEMLPAAAEIDEYWFHNRDKPAAGMEPFWMREHAMVLKLAMIMSACDSMDRIIRVKHINQAQDLVHIVGKYMPVVIEQSAKGGLVTVQDRAMDLIGKSKYGVTRTNLLRYLSRWGLKAKEVNQVIENLMEMGRVETTKRSNKTLYRAIVSPGIQWDQVAD
jgi:hypothetical protein